MIDTFDQFQSELHSALLHLNSADYEFPADFCQILGCDTDAVNTVQSRLIQWIKSLSPAPTIPQQGRSKQFYDVLHHRFILGLTQEESAHNLYMSTRTLQRIQRNAVHLLSRRIWESHEAYYIAINREDNPLYE